MKSILDLQRNLEDVKKMKVDRENKRIVLDFDNLNRINDLSPSTRTTYLVLLKHLLTFSEDRKKAFVSVTGEDLREFVGLLRDRKIKTQHNVGFTGSPQPNILSQGSIYPTS